MKKLVLIAVIALIGLQFKNANAQGSLKININSQPAWGPVGYDHVEYYYMPDIDTYYYVPTHQYIYQQRGRWVFAKSLPARFRYDINTGYKVVVNEAKPYRNHEKYKTKYASYKGNRGQEIIRNSRDSKYFGNKNHPEHNKWKKDKRRGNGNKPRY